MDGHRISTNKQQQKKQQIFFLLLTIDFFYHRRRKDVCKKKNYGNNHVLIVYRARFWFRGDVNGDRKTEKNQRSELTKNGNILFSISDARVCNLLAAICLRTSRMKKNTP